MLLRRHIQCLGGAYHFKPRSFINAELKFELSHGESSCFAGFQQKCLKHSNTNTTRPTHWTDRFKWQNWVAILYLRRYFAGSEADVQRFRRRPGFDPRSTPVGFDQSNRALQFAPQTDTVEPANGGKSSDVGWNACFNVNNIWLVGLLMPNQRPRINKTDDETSATTALRFQLYDSIALTNYQC